MANFFKIYIIFLVMLNIFIPEGEAKMIEANDNNFFTLIENNTNYVLVDFSAKWCGPCQMMAPILKNVAKDLEGRVDVVVVDVDEAQNACTKFGIRSVPTFIMFAPQGKIIGKMQGGATDEKFAQWILECLEQDSKEVK